MSDNSSDFGDDFSVAESIIMYGKDSHGSKSDISMMTKQEDDEWKTVSNENINVEQTQNPTCEKVKSMERTIKKMKKEAQVIEFTEKEYPNIDQWGQGDLSNIVYEKIKKAGPFSTILLPDRHLILP